ncbi:MAG: HNH endonuclease, partial [Chloroflexi bacterium]|nr:HNH endonuclease [Chloroflexota bacterium]
PRHRGGKHTWENLVSACKTCNHRKGGRTLEEAHMTLQRFPSQPRASIYYLFQPYLESFTEWRKFLPYWGRDSAAAFSYAQPTES